jgi:hypothetical protein
MGPQGNTGAPGAIGAAGSSGSTGAAGPQGVIGPEGLAGASGEQGDEGAEGAKGDEGAEGAKGDEGAEGAKGDKGDDGAKGANGTAGSVQTYVSNFQGSGLVLTAGSNPTTAFYVRNGDLVFFQIKVALDSVEDFGKGAYQLLLPFIPASNFVFRDAYIFDVGSSSNERNAISAYAVLGDQWADLYYSNNSADNLVMQNQPAKLSQEDFIYISGTYTVSSK